MVDDDNFVFTEINPDMYSFEDASVERDEFIKICQKDDWSNKDFARLKELSRTVGAMPDKHPDVVNFAYYAMDKAIESGDKQSIKDALSLTDRIFTHNFHSQSYRPNEDSPISINKFRSNVDDLLYAHFSNPKHNFQPHFYEKLYPQGYLKLSAFKMLESGRGDDGSSNLQKVNQAVVTYDSAPNQRQLESLTRELERSMSRDDIDMERIIERMTPEVRGAEGDNLLKSGKADNKLMRDYQYQTDLSKYPGNGKAEIAMKFSDNYQYQSLIMGLPVEEAIQQTPETILYSLHKHKVLSDPTYRDIPDTIGETLTKLPTRMSNAIKDVFTPKKQGVITPSIDGVTTNSKDDALPVSKGGTLAGGNNALHVSKEINVGEGSNALPAPGDNTSINVPQSKVPTTSQLALGAVAVGAVAMGAKKVYNFYTQNFGEDAAPEKIREAKSLISNIVNSDQDLTKIYNDLTSQTNKLTREVNYLYDQQQQNSPLYKKTRENLDRLLQTKEKAYDLENRVIQIKEDFKNLDNSNLKVKYIDGLIKEYHDIEKGYDKLILEKSIYDMRQKEPVKKKSVTSSRPPRSHAERILEEKRENKQRSFGRSQE